MTAEGMAANRSGIAAPLKPTASKRGGRAIRSVGRRSRKPENLTARPLGMRISRKLIESFASLRLAKLVDSRRSRLPCAVRAWPRSEATSKLKGNLLRGCGLPSAPECARNGQLFDAALEYIALCEKIRGDHERQGLRAPEFEIDPDEILTDVWDRTVSLSARAQNRLNATSLALDHLRQQLTREVAALERLLAANSHNRAIRRDLEFLRQMLRRLN
jgi:hypothetical protein